MKRTVFAFMFLFSMSLAHAADRPLLDTISAIKKLKQLYETEERLYANNDVAALNGFYPDDFMVTNARGVLRNKQEHMNRVKNDSVKYTSLTRSFDAFKFYGNTVVVLGTEVAAIPANANNPFAGKTIHRRFTEVWVLRKGEWQKVVRQVTFIED